MAESEEELKKPLMKVKEENEKAGLKLNIQKTKIMASGPITLSRECVISLVLYHHNKNLKLRTLKPSACLSSWTDHVAAACYSLVLFRK